MDFRKSRKDIADSGESPRKIEVGRIEPTHDIASAFFKALVDGIVLARVVFATPKGEVGFVSSDEFFAAVGRASVDDDVFGLSTTIFCRNQDTLEGLFQV